MAHLDTMTAAHGENADRSPLRCRRLPFQSPRQQSDHRPSAHKQRSLKLHHVDSLLLPKLLSPLKSSASLQKHVLPRATPVRIAKQKVEYSAADQSPEDLGHDKLDSEWQYSVESSEDDSSDEDDIWGHHIQSARELDPWPRNNQFQSPSVLVGYDRETRTTSRPTSSSDHDAGAIMRFSPPRTRNPLKKPPADHPSTPSPPQSPTKSKLTSPRKSNKIPPTPHRPSLDAFWSADVVNTWNDEYSPRKIFKSTRNVTIPSDSDNESTFTPTASPRKSPPKQSPAKASRAATEAKKRFELSKHSTAEAFLRELDRNITKGEIAELTASTGGVKIVWSKKLNSTAGRAHWRREAIKSPQLAAPDGRPFIDNKDLGHSQAPKITYRHFASIELAEKVIDDEARLLNVLAHEYCHLVNFMISGVKDQPHGTSFKRWASLVSTAFADRDVVVTTKHSYEIQYKYSWRCCSSDCGVEYARHSRSIDPKKHTCGKCRGRLEQIRPAPRKARQGPDTQTAAGARSEYQQFVKEQFGVVRGELGQQSPMKEVMREIGARYRMRKGERATNNPSAHQEENATGTKTVEVIEIDDDGDEDEDGGEEEDPSSRDNVDKDDKDDKGNGDNLARILTFLTIRDD